MSKLSQNLKYYRKLANLKQEEIAHYLGKSKGVVSNWEKGVNKPDADTIGKICIFLEIMPNDLMGWVDNSNSGINVAQNPEETTLIQKYRQLPNRGKQAVLNTLNFEYDQHKQEEEENAPKDIKKAM